MTEYAVQNVTSDDNFSFHSQNNKKKDLSIRLLKPLLIYMESKYSQTFLLRFVSETDMEMEYLENEISTMSFEYYAQFLEKFVADTDDRDAIYDSGINLIRREAYGSFFGPLSLLKHFKTPNAVYERIGLLFPGLDKVLKYEVLSKGKNRLIVRFQAKGGRKQTRLMCSSIKGLLASVPGFWGFPPARIKELYCVSEGSDACIYEISWVGKPRRTLLFYVFALATLALETVLVAANALSFLGLEEILITCGAFGIMLLAHRVYQSGRVLDEYKNMQEERTKSLEQALAAARNDFTKLQETNLQIVEKANRMSILNYIAEEMSKVTQENDMLLLILKIIVDCMGFDRGYYLCYDANSRLMGEPVLVEKFVNNDEDDVRESFAIITNKPGSYKLFKNRKPQVSRANEVFDTSLDHEILFIPISVYNSFLYLLCFDSFYSQAGIKEKNMQFFSTVERQVEISMNNLFAVKSAHNVLSSIPSSIVVFDKNSLLISYVNQAYLKNFKVQIEDVLAENILTFLKISDDYKPIYIQQIEETMKKNFLYDQELLSGTRILGYTLFKMPGGIAGKNEIGMIMKDITEQKEFHEQLIRGEKLAALGTLASGIAHEINNPLYGILGTAEVIADEAGNEEVKGLANDIIDYTMQASDIVKDLSAYSRSLREEKPKDVNVNEVIEDSLRMIGYSPKFIDIQVEKALEEIPEIYAIGGEIRQVYMNIMNNAVQAMDGKGKLRVTSRIADAYIVTTVEDSGPGIPESLLSQIFDPFFTTKPPGEGTGIGLTVVYRIVTKYTGFVSVSSRLGEGTVFTIKFPIKKEKQ